MIIAYSITISTKSISKRSPTYLRMVGEVDESHFGPHGVRAEPLHGLLHFEGPVVVVDLATLSPRSAHQDEANDTIVRHGLRQGEQEVREGASGVDQQNVLLQLGCAQVLSPWCSCCYRNPLQSP